jgi:hypothetical protein
MKTTELTEKEQQALDEKIRKLVTPPDKSNYANKKTPELSEDERKKFHLNLTEELDLVRKMVEKSVKQSVDQPFLSKAADLALIGTPAAVEPETRPVLALKLMG